MGPLSGAEEVRVGTVVTVELGGLPVVEVVIPVVRVGATVVVADVRVVVRSVVAVVGVGVCVRLVVRVAVAGDSGAGVTWVVRAGEPAGGGRTRT